MLYQTMAEPPVTGSVTPVMKPASSESRNAMAGTTSAGVALRPMGFSSAAACTMRSGVSFRKFVSIMLGDDAVDRDAEAGILDGQALDQPADGALGHDVSGGILGRAADGVARLDEQHTAKPGLGHGGQHGAADAHGAVDLNFQIAVKAGLVERLEFGVHNGQRGQVDEMRRRGAEAASTCTKVSTLARSDRSTSNGRT